MNEDKKNIIQVFLLILIIIGFGLLFTQNYWVPGLVNCILKTPVGTIKPFSSLASGTPVFDQTGSLSGITFTYSAADYILATGGEQNPVRSYIPACDEGFDYCLYYTNPKHLGTNFESAGVRFQERADLVGESVCLDTPPAGYDAKVFPNFTDYQPGYSFSVFSNLSNGAAGHYAVGALYRLYVENSSTCYEFETRIGQTQFLNYPSGAIKEFTAGDEKNLQMELTQIVSQISF